MGPGQPQILAFGDDRSLSADAAWLWVVSQHWPGWRIRVVSAEPDGPEILVPEPWDPPHPRRHPDPDVVVVHEVVRAEPRRALTRLAGQDLLVIGPRGAGLAKRLGIGSVSTAVLRDPPGPVVIVHHADPVRRVVFCADGSPHSRAALDALRRMPWIGEVPVRVVSVRESGIDAGAAARAAADALQGTAAAVEVGLLEPDPRDLFHRTEDLIFEELRRWGADLVVIGTRGLGVTDSLRAGSIATSMAGNAPCSVLLAAQVR
jgi:nucleotide-binding universal stress UspA family protein